MIVVVKALVSEDVGTLGVVGSPLMIWLRTEAAFMPMQVAWKNEQCSRFGLLSPT